MMKFACQFSDCCELSSFWHMKQGSFVYPCIFFLFKSHCVQVDMEHMDEYHFCLQVGSQLIATIEENIYKASSH